MEKIYIYEQTCFDVVFLSKNITRLFTHVFLHLVLPHYIIMVKSPLPR